MSRPAARRVHAAVAVFSLALWLFLLVAETWTPLHAWLHGGSIPDNDSCAIVALAHGTVESASFGDSLTAPSAPIEYTPRLEFFHFSSVIAFLPAGRAPPSLCTVS
jgi:hypothetical protein